MADYVRIDMSQENVAKAIRKLREQGWEQCLNSRRDGCTYQELEEGKSERRCAIGWLVADEDIAKIANSTQGIEALSGVFTDDEKRVELVSPPHISASDVTVAARQFQQVHDRSTVPSNMRMDMQAWCKKWGYKFPEETEVNQ